MCYPPISDKTVFTPKNFLACIRRSNIDLRMKLHNLLCLWKKKTYVVFSFFIWATILFPFWMPWSLPMIWQFFLKICGSLESVENSLRKIIQADSSKEFFSPWKTKSSTSKYIYLVKVHFSYLLYRSVNIVWLFSLFFSTWFQNVHNNCGFIFNYLAFFRRQRFFWNIEPYFPLKICETFKNWGGEEKNCGIYFKLSLV